MKIRPASDFADEPPPSNRRQRRGIFGTGAPLGRRGNLFSFPQDEIVKPEGKKANESIISHDIGPTVSPSGVTRKRRRVQKFKRSI